jgi:acetoin utilization deacetylase AcuC-like enzyme
VATYVCTDDIFLQHRPLGEHPERPERLTAIRSALASSELVGRYRTLAPRPATEQELERVHTADYLHMLYKRMGEPNSKGSGWLDPDTYYGPGTYAAALNAAGGATELALRVLQSQADNGFALVRPPGHHASASQAMGFCLINNVAVAAAAARAQGARVAIVDLDVHHGNGTEQIFERDSSLLFISSHQFPFYPGTGAVTAVGEGPAKGSKINIPLPEGSAGPEYRLAWKRIVIPALRRFAPDLILVSAGFDAHARDPLAGMALHEDDYAQLIHRLLAVQPRLVAVLEGGYHLESLAQSVVAVLRVLIDPAGYTPGTHDAGQPVAAMAKLAIGEVAKLHNLT